MKRFLVLAVLFSLSYLVPSVFASCGESRDCCKAEECQRVMVWVCVYDSAGDIKFKDCQNVSCTPCNSGGGSGGGGDDGAGDECDAELYPFGCDPWAY